MTTGAVGQLSRTQRISLRLWVFKFIDVEDIESFGVCVEGYRPNDDTETVLRNWHSTAITKRITPTLLHSCSGSVYELRGSIDRELARQYGYPPELTELFLNGFPENWKSILKEYFYVSNRRSERLSILPAPATLPVPIAEEIEADEGEKENSVLNSSSASAKKVKNAESATSNVSPLPSPAENNQTPKLNDGVSRFGTRRSPRIREILSRSGSKDSKVSAKDACETNECQSSANGMPGNVLEESTASSESSYIFVPRLNSETSQTLDQLPIVQSPGSIASSSISAGPVFEEPHCSGEISTRESSERANDDSARDLALVPVEPVFKVPSRRPSKGNHDDAVELSEWSIRFALGLDGPELGFPKFVLLGNRKGHVNQWRTSIIVRVESAEILHTSSTKYRLVGDMDIIDSASAGFPKMFVAKFVRGFPPDWRTRITELYNTFFANLGTHNGVDSHSETRQPLLFSEDSEESSRRSDIKGWLFEEFRYSKLQFRTGKECSN
ncbi:SANTA protein, partial [Ancylostoma duodenale]